MDNKTNKSSYGAGGGIVWDSDFLSEFHECMTKSKILTTTNANSNFELFETMLWEPKNGVFLSSFHFSRLRNSAVYFGFNWDSSKIEIELEECLKGCNSELMKIKLFLSSNGSIRISNSVLTSKEQKKNYSISLAKEPIDQQDVFYYHKTTKREIYEQAKPINPDSDDVLFWNEAGEITESKIANIIINIDGEWYTPPIISGLLGGTYRQMMIESQLLKERVIHKSEIINLTEITLINSVRGKFKAKLI